MRIHRQLGFLAGAATALLMGASAHAGSRPFMPMGETVAAPPGYTDLCQRGEVSCGTQVASVSATAAPTGAPTSALATSSIGAGSAPRFDAPVEASVDSDAAPMLEFAVLRAYRPAVDAQFAFATARVQAAFEADAPPASPAPIEAAPVAPAAPALVGAAQMRLVNAINREVNRDVHKATDFDLYGLLEYWSLPRVINGKMYGDCEDYALEKRRRLIAAGVPESALSMAVAVTARGETHAVLVVSFQSGDWVLDNLTPWATPWEDLNYRWVQRQVAGSSTWTTVS